MRITAGSRPDRSAARLARLTRLAHTGIAGARALAPAKGIARATVVWALAFTLAASVAACGRPKARAAPPEKTLQVTSKGYVILGNTTYRATGQSARLDPATLVYVGSSPNKRKFYAAKESVVAPQEMYLHTGKVFYDVWRPIPAPK